MLGDSISNKSEKSGENNQNNVPVTISSHLDQENLPLLNEDEGQADQNSNNRVKQNSRCELFALNIKMIWKVINYKELH